MTTTESRREPSTSARARARHRRREGAAYMESIIVLPALILVFSLTLFVRDGYTRAAKAGSETRGAGWANVMASCDSDSVPSPTLEDDLGSWGVASLGGIATIAPSIFTLASKQPLLIVGITAPTIASFKIDRRNYTQSASLTRSSAIGGSARYGHRIALTCDENMEDLKMPGFSVGTWNFSLWNQLAWNRAGL
ncbi:MAG: hypothetical protein GXP55_04335 [Deltaproteobacteria bacterium]|nr:hypothetical protein [Deltaproteobacteria bacterium]